MSVALAVRHVRKAYEQHLAVDDVTFEIPAGVVYGLIGPNGAGKTTTIRMIMDILRPDSGQVEVLGKPSGGGVLDRVGYLPEERGLYKKMKILDVLVYLGSLKGLSREEARKRADEWLSRLGLAEWRERKIEELSKGMAQKVQFISTLLARPDLLILDEPFAGLDPVNTNQLKDLFVEVNRAGTTIVFSTHQMETAEKLCRSICLINKGRVVLEGGLADIKHRYGRNNLLLEYTGDGAFLKDLQGVGSVDEYGAYVEVALSADGDPQRILRAAAEKLDIRRFEIVEPSLHNIFLAQVGAAPLPSGGAAAAAAAGGGR